MHVNERLFGRGIVDVGKKNSTTYDFSFFSSPFLLSIFFLFFPLSHLLKPMEIFFKATVYFYTTLLWQNGEITFSFSQEASCDWQVKRCRHVGLEPSVS